MRTKATLHSLFLMVVLGVCGIAQAATLSLDEAKQQGLVGEQYDGYLGVVDPDASAAVRSLVKEINGKRRAEYDRIAKSNGIDRSAVEALAGKKSIEKTASGGYVRLEGGDWRPKP